jgi:hypothetical protein
MLNTVPLQNYWTPLASRVEALDYDHLLSIHNTAPPRVTFTLSPGHIERDSTEYRRGHWGRPPDDRTVHLSIHISKMKQGV